MAPRFMKTDCAAQQLLEAVKTEAGDSYNGDTPCIGLARVGTNTQSIISGTLESFVDRDMGEPMHSLIICGEMHELEHEMFKFFEKK